MSYLGRSVDKISNIEKLDNITFDGSSSYTLQKSSVNFVPSSANAILISIDGVVQSGNFTVSGSTIDFGTAVASTSTCNFIIHLGVGLITAPSDGSVTAAKVADDLISGKTALGAEPADTDEFLVSDAGTLKRIDYSLIKGGGKINQVLNHGATVSSSSSSDVEMISLSITPTATSSKILIMFGVGAQLNSDEYASFDLYRGSLASGTKIMDGEQTVFSAANNVRFGYHFSHLDSPSTTSATTYTVVGVPLFSGTIMFGGGARQTISLMEVLA